MLADILPVFMNIANGKIYAADCTLQSAMDHGKSSR
jgi:hypothetical protein